jgi:hypothetical protein
VKALTLVAIACCAASAVALAQVRTSRAPIVSVSSTQVEVPCSTGDSTTAWNGAIARAVAGTDKIVHLYACTYHFQSTPAPISHGIEVLGQGMYTTYLERDYSPGHGCAASACEFISTVDIGETIKDLAIFAARGTSGGWGLHAISTDARKGNDVILDNVYISGYGTYSLPVFLDGQKSLQPPEGIRKVNFTNVTVFNGTWHGFVCWNCVGMSWHGGGLWEGFGTTQDAIVGGPLSTQNMIAAFVNGTVQYWAGSAIQ